MKKSILPPLAVALLCGCLKATGPAPAPSGMILIPAGPFLMGSNKIDKERQGAEFGAAKPWYLDEHPQRSVVLLAFYIDKFEVTNGDYEQFVLATESRPPIYWFGRRPPPRRETFPVTDVNWYDAERYCIWAGKRLPTEGEWEKAARGTDGREFPWGNDFDPKRANTGDSGRGDLAPVGSYPQGASPFGLMDAVGNVWEWTADWYQPYPGSDYVDSERFGQKEKIFRGGGWGGPGGHYSLPLFYRAAYRSSVPPEESYADLGLRCAKST